MTEEPAGKLPGKAALEGAALGKLATGTSVEEVPASPGAMGEIVGDEPAGPADVVDVDSVGGEPPEVTGFGGETAASVEWSAPDTPRVAGSEGSEVAEPDPVGFGTS